MSAPYEPKNWVELVTYAANRLGLDFAEDEYAAKPVPEWKRRTAEAGKIKRAGEKEGITVIQLARTVDYCFTYRCNITSPMGLLWWVDVARAEQERRFPAQERAARGPADELTAAWAEAIHTEVVRLSDSPSMDDLEARAWLTRFERTAGHMRREVLAEWEATRRGV
jgi:hypothetical protein